MSDVTRPRCRLAYLTNIPSPYRADMVRAWARDNPHLAISVFYTDPDDQGRGWGNDPVGAGVTETRLPVIAGIRRYGKLNRHLAAMVRAHDVIMIGGFEQASYLAAALFARLYRKPVVLLFDGFSPARFGREPAPILALKRFTARLAHGFFANGMVGARYLREQIGVPAGVPIRNQFLSHREAPIATARERFAEMDKAQIRQALGIPDDGRPILMTCGYLIPRKRIDLIIDAIAQMPPAKRPRLLVVGDGELRTALMDQAVQADVPAHFTGFKLGADLAAYYLAADAFILASDDDPWGLVLNEAMSAGLPVLASDACGAVLDLIRAGDNGFVFRSEDTDALRIALENLVHSDMTAMGQCSKSMIEQWNSARSAVELGKIAASVFGTTSASCPSSEKAS